MMLFIFFLKIFTLISRFGMQNCIELYDINMVRDIQNHFQFNWIIIQSCTEADYPVVNLLKEIMKFTDVYATIFNWEDFSSGDEWYLNFRPLVLLTCWSCSDCFQMVNRFNKDNFISRFTWLSVNNSDTTMLKIPLNCLFILIKQNTSGFFTLTEVYRISSHSPAIYREIGNWSFQTGLAFSKIPFEERRSNFLGETITTLVEPKGSLNRLFVIYNFYSYCYWDLSKRLNFTIQNVTNPAEPHEVTILMQWMDVETNETHLQSIYSSWQGIYFKDVGVSIQLDGYLKPFRWAVWIAAVVSFFYTGFFSYVIAKALRVVDADILRLRPDIYIYDSFYIFFQRGQVSGKFAAQKIIILSQWILATCLFNYYSAVFISFISVVIPKPPFRTVDDILQQKTHNIVSTKHLSAGTVDNLEKSGDQGLRSLYKNHFDPTKNFEDDPVRAFCMRDNYLFITSESHMKKVKSSPEYQNCKVSDTYIRITHRHMTWSVTNGSQYDRFLRFYLYKLNSAGALEDSFVKKQILKRKTENINFREMVLEDTIILFTVLTAGLIISIFLLLLEIFYKRLKMIYK